jgi:hypothetical protein
MNRPLPVSLLLLISLLPPTAVAAEASTIVGGRASFLRAIQPHAKPHFGGGLSVERAVVHHLLEVELVAGLLPGEHATLLPVELLLKVPFHPTSWLQPYLGLGPAMVVSFDHGEASPHFGAAAVAGAYFWLGGGLGLMLEVQQELLYDHGVVPEFGTAAGVVWAF